MLVVGNMCECACVHVHTMSKRKTKLHPFCHSTSSWNMCVHTMLQPIFNSNCSWCTHKCMCAYVSVHVYIRTSAGTCIPQSTCKSQTTPPCLKQDPFAAEFTILPGEQLLEILVSPSCISLVWDYSCLCYHTLFMYTWCSLSNKTANEVTLQNMLPSLSDKWPQVHCKWKGGFIQVWLDELLGLTGVTEHERGVAYRAWQLTGNYTTLQNLL